MKLKTYFSDSVEAAIRIAKVELGHEAVFVGSRRNTGAGAKGRLQVTFATPRAEDSATREDAQASSGPTRPAEGQDALNGRHWKKFIPRELLREAEPELPPAAPELPRGERFDAANDAPPRDEPTPEPGVLNRRIEDLAHQVGELRMLFVSRTEPRTAPPPQPNVAPPPQPNAARFVTEALLRAGVESKLARRLTGRPPIEPDLPGAQVLAEVRRRLLGRIETDAALPLAEGTTGAVVLVGPSGAGKTAAAARLAVQRGIDQGLRVALICVDPLRVGAVESLQAYSKILQTSFRVVDHPENLAAALRAITGQRRPPDFVLIDTPGYAPSEAGRLDRLSDALQACRTETRRLELQTQLVLSASGLAHDWRATIQRFEPCEPSRLLFTHLDECRLHGPLVNAAALTRLPLSFFCTGPRIQDDLAPASAQRLCEFVLAEADPDGHPSRGRRD